MTSYEIFDNICKRFCLDIGWGISFLTATLKILPPAMQKESTGVVRSKRKNSSLWREGVY